MGSIDTAVSADGSRTTLSPSIGQRRAYAFLSSRKPEALKAGKSVFLIFPDEMHYVLRLERIALVPPTPVAPGRARRLGARRSAAGGT